MFVSNFITNEMYHVYKILCKNITIEMNFIEQ